MKKKSKVKGLAGAQAMVKELEFLTKANIGADYLADQVRTPTFGAKKSISHADVIDYLAQGGRSLYANDEESVTAAKMIRDNIAKQLKRTGQTVTNKQGVSKVLTDKKQALSGAVSGLRKAAKYIAKMMTKRMKAQSTTSGGSADKVSEQYARRRNTQYNVNESVVYVASGQLANAIASGKVKVYYKDANVSSLLSNI